jgi:hypothetical protein
MLPISLITFLMVLVGSYGTRPFDPVGFLTIAVAPPVALVAGVGLLRRWRWARLVLLALAAAVLGSAVSDLARGPTPQQEFVSPSGTKTTIMATQPRGVVPRVGVSLGVIVLLLLPGVRKEFAGGATASRVARTPLTSAPAPVADEVPRSGWRVGHRGRDCMYYEEWRDGAWQRLDISGEMLMGPAHHVIYFDSPSRWLTHPEWARHRRGEIIARIKSEFRPPDYEYIGDGPMDPAG